MSVPLDRLYNYLDSLCNHDLLIYRFSPHGSKNLTDLTGLTNYYSFGWQRCLLTPGVIVYDQEPLYFNASTVNTLVVAAGIVHKIPDSIHKQTLLDTFYKQQILTFWFRVLTDFRYGIYDKTLLIHSEKNSRDLDRFCGSGFIGVYWWSHAAIACDWYRFAKHDISLVINFEKITKDFLIYNRAWAGTREYRVKFTEIIVDQNLQNFCNMKFNPMDNQCHYRNFQPVNAAFKANRYDLENYFEPCTAAAHSSADYNSEDYISIAIEVVLETLFDDQRWQLTEKSLRPIACGRPFILAAAAGSLQYIRSYGFQTFAPYIDESYDTIQDPLLRLAAITNEMKRISQLSREDKRSLWRAIYCVAKHNQDVFFNDPWQSGIFKEFVTNINQGLAIMEQHKTGSHWKQMLKRLSDKKSLMLSPHLGSPSPMLLASLQHEDEIDKLIQQAGPDKSI